MPYIFTVSELTQGLKDLLESNFPFVWVRGQISNYSKATSGHIYFTLKDEQACLQVVWFKGSQVGRDREGRKLSELLGDGQEIIVAGKINVYPQRGVYQLIAEFVQEVGLGSLFLAFEALKQKLEKEGLFALENKKTIPFNPYKVGVITAPNSAALQDFLKIARDYGLSKEIVVYPTSVQGKESVEQLVRAIELANLKEEVEVLVLIRGGGSLEDLWSFNTEEVARAIFSSKLPVITGIGHEVDFTIADFVADKRASTPSHVPQLLWPLKENLVRQVDELQMDLEQGFFAFLKQKEESFLHLKQKLFYLSPREKINSLINKFNYLKQELLHLWQEFILKKENILSSKQSILFDKLNNFKLDEKEYRLSLIRQELLNWIEFFLQNKDYKLDLLANNLEQSSPLKPLEKGYILISKKRNNKLVKRAKELKSQEEVELRFYDGKKDAKII